LAIEKGKNVMDLKQFWIDRNGFNNIDIGIMFQIIYTLELFNSYGIRHNDLHFRNILIRDYGRNIFARFRINAVDFYIPMRYRAYIFDLDKATVVDPLTEVFLPEYYNTTAEYFCRELGTCNSWNPKFDVFKFLCSLAEMTYEKDARTIGLLARSTNIIRASKKDNSFCFLPQINRLRTETSDYVPDDDLDELSLSDSKKRRKFVENVKEIENPQDAEFCKLPLQILEDEVFKIFTMKNAKKDFDSQPKELKLEFNFTFKPLEYSYRDRN
jgi:hypothetical protein